MNDIVYIPIEKKNREILAKILVSIDLVENGVAVVLGVQKAVHAVASIGRPGVIFYKGLNKVQHDQMEVMARAGHDAVAIDEESLASWDAKFLTLNCWRDIARSVSSVFCQGTIQHDALGRYRGLSRDQLVITGNPRIDLLRPPFVGMFEAKVEEIRRVHGRFVLINTDYGSINGAHMDLEEFRRMAAKIGYFDPESSEDQDLMEDRVTHDRNAMKSIEEFIHAMARSDPGRKLILRPHPTESDKIWRDLAARVENLTVVTETSAPEWILAADCLIQTGCTTGVEAAILGTPTIGLVRQPEGILHPGLILTHKINPTVSSVDDAVDAVRRLSLGDAPEFEARTESKRRLLQPHVDIDPNVFAYQKISNGILSRTSGLGSTRHEDIPSIDHEVDKILRATVTRRQYVDAYFSLEELNILLAQVATARGKEWQGAVRDLGWGVYAISAGRVGGG